MVKKRHAISEHYFPTGMDSTVTMPKRLPYDAATALVNMIFYIITVIQITAELTNVMLLSPDLREGRLLGNPINK